MFRILHYTHMCVKSVIALTSISAFGQQFKANAYVPSPIPAALADYSLPKPMVIAKEGVYACNDGYDMYVNLPEPKVKAKDYVKRADPKALIPVLDIRARMGSIPGYVEYVPICVRIEVK